MSCEPITLSAPYCQHRQQQVHRLLERLRVDRAIFLTHENIQYLTGFRPHHLMQAALCIDAGGECVLAAPNEEPAGAVVNSCVTFEAQWHCTLRQDQQQAALTALFDACGQQQKSLAAEGSAAGLHLPALAADSLKVVDLEPDMWQLRRKKYPDELQMIRRAIDCTDAMYQRARDIIEPGINELEVYNQLHAAAVEAAGEPLTALGNDFQCGSPGGPPRGRAAQDGELYILDLGPAYRGYYADNCRTFAVNGEPTDEQYKAWEIIVAVLEIVERTVRPGVSCRQLFEQAQAMLDEYKPEAFFHHLGHGFGLYPHEAPHLNPHWDDTFAEGDCFTAEPGLYTEDVNAGIRLEQNYVVTSDGVERLTNFPLQL